jgi:hypothetical protein
MRSAGSTQYLARYAAPEATLARQLGERYHAALVVPVLREAPSFLSGYRTALDGAAGRVLVIIVVNAAAPVARTHWPEHEALLRSLRGENARALSSAPAVWLARHGCFDVLSIDRAHPDHCFPEREGVGLARRIGCDLALAAISEGLVADDLIYCTDADAELPAGYFDARARAAADASCVVFDFWHTPSGDAQIDAATAVYELGLRYYVAGLAYARSPFAYHSIGSTLAVRAAAYAAVRGFPRRLGGEDFYLLNKAAKVGSIWRDDAHTIRLASRASTRTVHGTGPAALRLARESLDFAPFYHPEIFGALRQWLAAMSSFAADRDLSAAREKICSGTFHTELDATLEAFGAWRALEDAARQTRSSDALRQRLHGWFDAFRTLKLVHALRERGFASLPFRGALAMAPFRPSGVAADAPVDLLRHAFAQSLAQEAPALGIGTPNDGLLRSRTVRRE